MRISFFVCGLILVITHHAVAQDSLFSTKVAFPHADFEGAFLDAAEHFDGDLFVYFYRLDSSNHAAILANAFSRDSLAQYINTRYARIAVDTATPEGRAVLQRYRIDLPTWSFVTLIRTDEPRPTGMHGWENISDEEDARRWLKRLRLHKERRSVFDTGEWPP